MNENFKKKEKLRKKDIYLILKIGKKVHSKFFTIYYNDSEQPKFGISLRKGIKGAVKRNKLKRRLRAVIRKIILINKKEFFLIANKYSVDLAYNNIEKEIKYLFYKIEEDKN